MRGARGVGLAVLLLGLAVGAMTLLPGWTARHVAPFLLYHPSPLPAPAADPAAHGLPDGEEVRIRAADGVDLHGWWVPARRGLPDAEGCGSVLFLHGNAGTLAGRAFIAEAFSRRGYDVLLVDYRGYGRSEGRPTEEGLYRDGEAAYRHLRTVRGIRAERIAVAGHSLGGAVAARVAEGASPGAVVLTATFRSVPELAADLYPWLPARIFRGWPENRYEVEDRIPRISAPLLVARGARDDLVPRDHPRGLYRAAADPKRWHEAREAGHNDLWSDSGFWGELDRFLREALGCG